MANPAVTYTFANSTTADATQVNQNFTDLINGMTDGTKDHSISALTCAGNATFNGNVALGNGSGDDITFTGSVASSIPVKAANTYDLGSATLAMRSFYIAASDSSAHSVRLLGSVIGTSYTITLPTAAPSIAKSIMTLDTSGVGSFEHRSVQTVVSKTFSDTPYTALTSDQIILVNATGGAVTVNLPASSSVTGKRLFIKKTDASANAVTLDGNSSETIDGGTTTTLNTQYESLEIACDGSNWHIVERRIPSGYATATLATGATTTPPTKGTIVSDVVQYWRNGRFLEMIVNFIQSGGSPAAGSGTYLFTLPNSLSFGSNVNTNTSITSDGIDNSDLVGQGWLQRSGAHAMSIYAHAYDSTRYYIRAGIVLDTTAASTPTAESANAVAAGSIVNFAHNISIQLYMKFTISGWLD